MAKVAAAGRFPQRLPPQLSNVAETGRMKKPKVSDKSQSARFIEAAKKTGADESGKAFETAFKKIAPPKKAKAPRR